MAAKEVLLTRQGIKKMENKLDHLKTVRRHEVAERIKLAISFGDISENAEYDEAKNEQAFVEGEILSIENMLRYARVIDDEDVSTDVVGVGCVVRVHDEEFDEEFEYTICGSAEADPSQSMISNESPVGSALLGNAVGTVVDVQAPAGTIKLKILDIRKA